MMRIVTSRRSGGRALSEPTTGPCPKEALITPVIPGSDPGSQAGEIPEQVRDDVTDQRFSTFTALRLASTWRWVSLSPMVAKVIRALREPSVCWTTTTLTLSPGMEPR